MTLEDIRIKRHLAAFMGDCGITTCTVCSPRRTEDPTPEWMRRALAGKLPVKVLR